MAPKATKETKDTSAKTAKAVKKPVENVFISKDDEYLFAQGTHYDIYKKLGAHRVVQDEVLKQSGVFLEPEVRFL